MSVRIISATCSKKITGFNLWEYVIKLRMELSKSLITGTDLRRYEIAERVGYESPEHFSKIFKKNSTELAQVK